MNQRYHQLSISYMDKIIVAVILARGGSKGIPRKNVLPVGGVPLVGRSIIAVKNTPGVSDVYVSTDDEEIASVAREYGAQVVIRPAELATDTSSSEGALLHFAEAVPVDAYVFIQCTSPFTTTEDFAQGIEVFNQPEIDSVLAVTEDHGGFLCGGFTWNEDGESVNYNYLSRPRRQDMKKTYRENGAFYIMSRQGLLEHKNRLHGKVGLAHITRLRSFEIDEPEDMSLAEHHFQWLKQNRHITE